MKTSLISISFVFATLFACQTVAGQWKLDAANRYWHENDPVFDGLAPCLAMIGYTDAQFGVRMGLDNRTTVVFGQDFKIFSVNEWFAPIKVDFGSVSFDVAFHTYFNFSPSVDQTKIVTLAPKKQDLEDFFEALRSNSKVTIWMDDDLYFDISLKGSKKALNDAETCRKVQYKIVTERQMSMMTQGLPDFRIFSLPPNPYDRPAFPSR